MVRTFNNPQTRAIPSNHHNRPGPALASPLLLGLICNPDHSTPSEKSLSAVSVEPDRTANDRSFDNSRVAMQERHGTIDRSTSSEPPQRLYLTMPHPDLTVLESSTRINLVQRARGDGSAVGFATSDIFRTGGTWAFTINDRDKAARAARNFRTEFQKRCAKPVDRITYGHSSRDRTCNVNMITDDGLQNCAIHLFSSDRKACAEFGSKWLNHD